VISYRWNLSLGIVGVGIVAGGCGKRIVLADHAHALSNHLNFIFTLLVTLMRFTNIGILLLLWRVVSPTLRVFLVGIGVAGKVP
jgi:hypothetical protein